MNEILKKSSEDLRLNSNKPEWGGVATVSNNVLDSTVAELKKLRHHKDSSVGLFVIDFDPKGLMHMFINSQSDACQLNAEDAEQLQKDWEKWLDDKNETENPFFQLTEPR